MLKHKKPSLLNEISCDSHSSPEAAANAQRPGVGANGSNTLSVNKGQTRTRCRTWEMEWSTQEASVGICRGSLLSAHTAPQM